MELLLSKAIDLTQSDIERQMELTNRTGQSIYMAPPIMTIAHYFEFLSEVYNTGKVPEKVEKQVNDDITKIKKANS